jgi:isocitrate dehydrogenase
MKIRKDKDKDTLTVPDRVNIPFIEGDGVGAEITPVCRRVVDAALTRVYGGKRAIEWIELLAGEKARRETGVTLPENTIETLRDCLAGIKGPLATPAGEGARSLNVTMRRELDLYVCLRPVRWFRGAASPLREPQKVDMIVFRENTEDLYSGIEWEAGSDGARRCMDFLTAEGQADKVRFPRSSAFGVKPVSVEGSERLVRAAIDYALVHNRKRVTLVHKGNIMKFTEGGFMKWGYALAEREYGEALRDGRLRINDVIADAFMQNALLMPEEYSVVATLNLNGDYVSDLLAAMVGGIGIAPGANINYATGAAVFEATHGTAPNIAGRNAANPSSLILSAVMMLEYLGWNEAARAITDAMEKAFVAGEATADLARFMPNGKPLGTREFGERIIELLNG